MVPQFKKVRQVAVRKGDLIRFYVNGQYQYSVPVKELKNFVGAVLEAIKHPNKHMAADVTEIVETELGENHS